MSKVAFVGNKKLGYLFRSFDFSFFPAENESEAKEKILEIYKKRNFDIVITTEELAGELSEFIRKKENVFPVIFVLPSPAKHEQLGIQWIRKSVERAVGIDILSKNE